MISKRRTGHSAITAPSRRKLCLGGQQQDTKNGNFMKRKLTLISLALLVFGATGVWRVSASTTNLVVFLETMATNAVKPWTGSGCNNSWIVSFTDNNNPFEQATNANYGGGNPCGLTFKNGTTNLSDSMITTALGIDAQGNSGTLAFYLEADSLTGYAGWAMQLNPGTGFTTRLSELTASNHPYQLYTYNLQPGDLVSNLTLRFQFCGGSTTNRIQLDDISLTVVIGTNTSSSWSMTNLPDTGQIISYTSTFGEDSDYTIHPPAYVNNGDGTISDKVTGLMWQQTDGGEMTWNNAASYATGLTLGGYTDWRLPTSHELYSLTKQNGFTPAIDTNYFIVTTAGYWWTRDGQVGNTSNVWAVSASGAIGPIPMNATISAGGTTQVHVWCVRGAAAPSTNSPIHHFTNNGNGTITDTDTGLMWQQAEISSVTNWEGALQYALSNSLGGYSNWRVPNIKELQSINDETLMGPSVDTTYFPGATASRYWSSTTVPSATNLAAWATISAWTRSVRSMRTQLANATPSNVPSSDWSRNPLRSFWSMGITNRHRCSISTSPTFATRSRSWRKMPATAIFPCLHPTAFTPATPPR
jgi:hypothetical protein